MSDLKKEIRFKNLPLLLKDMEIKKWVIDSFFFPYKNKNYIVILKLYRENEKRPSKYAKATVEFIKQENVNILIFIMYILIVRLYSVNFSVLNKVTPIEICLKIFLLYFHVIYHQKR